MDLLPALEPILEKYGVQAYFCGHEHNLQYIHQPNSSVHYVVTGGGSLTDYTPIVHYDNGGSRFQYWGSGEIRLKCIASNCSRIPCTRVVLSDYACLESMHLLTALIKPLWHAVLCAFNPAQGMFYVLCCTWLILIVELQALSPACWKAPACVVIFMASRKADQYIAFKCIPD